MSRAPASLYVEAGGPLTTVQDLGRVGLAALGVGRSGPCDRASYLLANRLVGNDPNRAMLEITFGGLACRPSQDVMIALTGARCTDAPYNAPFFLRAGEQLRLDQPLTGIRTYLAVRGGIDVPEVLRSRSTDTLAGLGPATVTAGTDLPIGPPPATFPNVDCAPAAEPAAGEITIDVLPGPRRDWFTGHAWSTLLGTRYETTSDTDRVGTRLAGQPLERARTGELPSEGMARGAIQVPPSGLPVIFLADHPITGGYPVIAYVDETDLDRCGQLRPGQPVQFKAATPPIR